MSLQANWCVDKGNRVKPPWALKGLTLLPSSSLYWSLKSGEGSKNYKNSVISDLHL